MLRGLFGPCGRRQLFQVLEKRTVGSTLCAGTPSSSSSLLGSCRSISISSSAHTVHGLYGDFRSRSCMSHMRDGRLGSVRYRTKQKIKKQLNVHRRSLKTRKAASKRLKRTANGGLKRGRAGKAHLNHGKSRTRLQRLHNKVRLKGSFLKKMNTLLLGKRWRSKKSDFGLGREEPKMKKFIYSLWFRMKPRFNTSPCCSTRPSFSTFDLPSFSFRTLDTRPIEGWNGHGSLDN